MNDYQVIFDGKFTRSSPNRKAAEMKIKRYLQRHTDMGLYASAVWIFFTQSKGFNNWKDVDEKLLKEKRRVRVPALTKQRPTNK